MSDMAGVTAMLPFERRTVNIDMFRTCVYDTVTSLFWVASQLNRWLLKRRRASVQRRFALAPVRRCWRAAAHLVAVFHDEPAHLRNFLRRVLVLASVTTDMIPERVFTNAHHLSPLCKLP